MRAIRVQHDNITGLRPAPVFQLRPQRATFSNEIGDRVIVGGGQRVGEPRDCSFEIRPLISGELYRFLDRTGIAPKVAPIVAPWCPRGLQRHRNRCVARRDSGYLDIRGMVNMA